MSFDLVGFFKFVVKYLWVLILAMLLGMGITYFFVKDLPQRYRSQAQIALESQQFLERYAGPRNDYGNVMEMLEMRRVMNLLTYQLILHDLQHPDQAFREIPEEVMELDSVGWQTLSLEYKKRLLDKAILTPADDIPHNLFQIASKMGYNHENLLYALDVLPTASNLIRIEFESESPTLSTFAVNTLATEFIHYYQDITTNSSNSSLKLLDSILNDKREVMNEKAAQLEAYKSSRGVLNVGTQSGLAYQRVSQYEERLATAIREVESTKRAIARLDEQLKNAGESYLNQSTSVQNNRITRLEDALNEANKRYLDNGFRPEDKRAVDSLQELRRSALSEASSQSNSPSRQTTTVRESLLADRMRLATALSLAEGGLPSIRQELENARRQYNVLVPTDADVQRYERESEVATNDYLEALSRVNQASLEKTAGVKLNLIEPGFPGPPESSKSFIYVGMSGVGSLAMSFFVLFLFFLFDHRILNAQQLAFATKTHVVGSLNLIKEGNMDLRNIWDDDQPRLDHALYRDLLRSLRFEIDMRLKKDGGKVLGITSINSGEGKTFLSFGLAYSFAMIGKKVLLIGEDFSNLTDVVTLNAKKPESGEEEFEMFLTKKEIQASDFITIMNRNSNSTSLLEMKDAENLIAGFDILRKEFDLVIIDMDSLKEVHKAKEWLLFVDACISVFPFGKTIKPEDKELVSFINDQKRFLGWVLNKIPLKKKQSA